MKLARYVGGGQVEIREESAPACPPGGLLVKTEGCGLCSGELMDWYMNQKVPHVLGHEVAGLVIESQDERFPVGARVFPHHHAPCLHCDFCARGLYVHCTQWKRTKLDPGGMAEIFAVSAENLNDTLLVDDMRAIDSALIEPLACVVKSLRGIGFQPMRRTAFKAVPDATDLDSSSIKKREGAYLPHWARKKGIYFVTFRLADAVPRHVLEGWKSERERLEHLTTTGELSLRDQLEMKRLLGEKREAYLDAGVGSCHLKDPRAAKIVAGAIEHFEGSRYRTHAWAVMPNHVHAVIEPLEGHELSEILHSWKSFTSNKINRLEGLSGALWQAESYDHLVRSESDLARCCEYVVNNPMAAGLHEWPWVKDHYRGLEAPDTHRLEADATAVIGLGVMGLMHALLLPGCIAYELNPNRVEHAKSLGIDARRPDQSEKARTVFVCPGTKQALDLAINLIEPGGTIVLFAPMPPGEETPVDLNRLYFLDAKIVSVYSCGPDDTREAAAILRSGQIRAEQLVSDFIGIDDLPKAYSAMKRGEILKAMVLFDDAAKIARLGEASRDVET